MKVTVCERTESDPPMREITKLVVLLRAGLELPVGLKLKTYAFRGNWGFVRLRGASRLEKRVQRFGWHFIRTANELPICGVGETPQQAIASALQLALGRTDRYFNGVEVGRINVTTYPWFVLARVGLRLFRIQQRPVRSIPESALPHPVSILKWRSPVGTPWLSPASGSAMSLLKQPSLEFQSSEAKPQ
ncbi:MAG TPA: hypothetical protein VFB43_07370 [Terracidiphilus sp.]|nr:hypothetical protein [Terracidiphilus sp.]